VDLDQNGDIDQDLDQEQQNCAEPVAGREQRLEGNVELDKERNVEVDVDTLVNPLAAVGSNANQDGHEQVDDDGDLSVKQPKEVDVQLDNGSNSNVDESLDLDNDVVWLGSVVQALVQETQLNIEINLQLDQDCFHIISSCATKSACPAGDEAMLGESNGGSGRSDGRGTCEQSQRGKQNEHKGRKAGEGTVKLHGGQVDCKGAWMKAGVQEENLCLPPSIKTLGLSFLGIVVV